jgi:hypothetical protein
MFSHKENVNQSWWSGSSSRAPAYQAVQTPLQQQQQKTNVNHDTKIPSTPDYMAVWLSSIKQRNGSSSRAPTLQAKSPEFLKLVQERAGNNRYRQGLPQ